MAPEHKYIELLTSIDNRLNSIHLALSIIAGGVLAMALGIWAAFFNAMTY